jgi:hypothetical protein
VEPRRLYPNLRGQETLKTSPTLGGEDIGVISHVHHRLSTSFQSGFSALLPPSYRGGEPYPSGSRSYLCLRNSPTRECRISYHQALHIEVLGEQFRHCVDNAHMHVMEPPEQRPLSNLTKCVSTVSFLMKLYFQSFLRPRRHILIETIPNLRSRVRPRTYQRIPASSPASKPYPYPSHRHRYRRTGDCRCPLSAAAISNRSCSEIAVCTFSALHKQPVCTFLHATIPTFVLFLYCTKRGFVRLLHCKNPAFVHIQNKLTPAAAKPTRPILPNQPFRGEN